MSLEEILADVDISAFPTLFYRTGRDSESLWLQVVDAALPAEFNGGRKWRVSAYACRSEVVQTAFAALLAWWEHEVREAFLWKGRSIYGPHSNLEALWGAADEHEYREQRPTFAEIS